QRLVVRALGPAPDTAGDPDAELVAQPLGGLEGLLAIRIAHHLGQPFAVPQVDEDHPAVVAATVNPAVERDFLVEVLERHLADVTTTHESILQSFRATPACACGPLLS